MKALHVSRRGFLLGASAVAGALVLGCRSGGEVTPSGDFRPNVWVRLESDGTLHLVCNRSEMGQGIRSSIPALLAQEMGASLDRVKVVQAPGDPIYGDQNTDGSRSIRNQYDMLRQVAAVARVMLIGAAAQRLGEPPSSLRCIDHAVVAESGERVPFGELAAAAAALPLPDPDYVPLRPDSEIAMGGVDLPLVDGHDIVTGAARFGADIVVDGMLTAVVVRPPVLGAHVASVDDTAARAVAGVVDVIEMPKWSAPAKFQPLGGVAVVAEHTWAAMQGARALSITWTASPNDTADSEADLDAMVASVQTAGTSRRATGDAAAALASAATTHSATYVTPFLVHAPLESPAAMAWYRGDACQIWSSVQTPQLTRQLVAEAVGLPEDAVRVEVTLLGAAFGRKSKPDFAVEAALLSKQTGRPVRVQWTRSDALQHGYYHAASAQRVDAGFDAAGALVAWRHRVASPTIGSTFDANVHELRTFELGQGLTDLPIHAPNVAVETYPVQEHVRIGWLRSVYNINHAFAVQSFLDELAHARGVSMPDLTKMVLGPPRRLTPEETGGEIPNYGASLDDHPVDVGRWHAVIDRVRALSGFDSPAPEGRARGFASHHSFLTYVGVVVEVSRGPTGPKVERAWVVADPGRIVNSDRVRAQMEGAVVFGATVALHGRIDFTNGAVTASNLDAYPLLRMTEAPEVTVELITEGQAPGGIGEPGVPPVAPAIANAWFALTGERARRLPIRT